jgi:hypothetical protein
MKRILLTVLVIGTAWLLTTGLTMPNSPELPMKKIHKAIAKVWKVEGFEVVNYENASGRECFDNGCWFKVLHNAQELGMVYVGRVNSCRTGGCAIDPTDEESLSFEFFDYFMLADPDGELRWVKVFNYQATQGHEVMSRGWLNQFKGKKATDQLVFGQNIEAISGATVSASAITEDINDILSCVSAE